MEDFEVMVIVDTILERNVEGIVLALPESDFLVLKVCFKSDEVGTRYPTLSCDFRQIDTLDVKIRCY